MQIYDVVLIPLIIGLVEVLKYFGIPKRVLPISALVFGVLAGVFYVYPNDVRGGILVGLMMGLSASGMYSGGKALIEKEPVEQDNRRDDEGE